MNQKDLNRISMWQAVNAVLQANQSIWADNAKFAEKATALNNLIITIGSKAQAQQSGSTGITSDKDALAQLAIDKTIIASKVAKAYAIDVKNHTLHDAVHYSKSNLENTPQGELEAKLSSILAAVGNVSSQILLQYGLPGNAIADASAAIADFAAAKPTTRQAIAEHKTITDSVPDTIRYGKRALTIIDNLVHLYDDTNPNFVSDYRNARVIVDAGHRSAAPVAPPPTH